MLQMVLGIVYDQQRQVVLIRKDRPSWQAGRLNFPGGKVEEGERPVDAVRREVHEETGLDIVGWEPVATLIGPTWNIHVYSCEVLDATIARTMESEQVLIVDMSDMYGDGYLLWTEVLPNLRWMLPLAMDKWAVKPVQVGVWK